MATLEELTRGASVKGVLPNGLVTVVDVKWVGTLAVEMTYKDAEGRLGHELLYRDQEPVLEVEEAGSPWSFDGDGGLFRLVSEAHRIRLAYLFDPLLAVHSSLVEPLPHQITAVYEEMLPRQPLRFLLADDPGAGKTIMTGLFIKELIARGDLQRCLIISPGNLVEQWQDELQDKFQLPFEIMTNDNFESARTGNWFQENPLAICRLDKLSRNEDVQAKLSTTDWDLVVFDEAHKLSAHIFGNEVSYTKRYRLGQLASSLTRHFLLLTATPHNGKEEDFQLFMALLDGDRFEGRFRDGVHTTDVSDLMRRLVKEQLYRFDGRPLFPERRAYAATYALSDEEADLYRQVTEYVREEFNRADNLENGGRRGTVGFALTILQRRLASSPAAIHQSLKRRRERLEKRLQEEQLLNRTRPTLDLNADLPTFDDDDLDDFDDAPDAEIEETEERVVDQASAARTIAELGAEIATLGRLEGAALRVRRGGNDRKWEELSKLLQNNPEMFDRDGHRRKLIIFTEHRDTLSYLVEQIGGLIGRPEAIVTIYGGMGREQRKVAENRFTQDPDVQVLVATDAAGEGINLQRAHLMVNYDLPWNPNRLEQRFGRIHRIGQTEVCHLWNLIARETREGAVYHRLLEKLDQEREALGGQVFDVLGTLTFEDQPLRKLLLQAIRYGEQPEVRARLNEVVEKALDRDHLRRLLDERALAGDTMDIRKVQEVRQAMERAEARRLQPHFIASFFMEAFRLLGGTIREREGRRYEITHVPATIRNRDRIIGTRESVLPKYERVTFHKDLIAVPGKPLAAFICPGHALLDATIDLIIERNRDLLKQGAVLVDEADDSERARVLVFLEHSVQDARTDRTGQRRIVSKQLQFCEVGPDGCARAGGYAPYLDYRPAREDELGLIDVSSVIGLSRNDIDEKVLEFAATELVPAHLTEVRSRKEALVDKTKAQVQNRLTKEITYWDHRAAELKDQELAGRTNARLNSGLARQRADDLTARLQKRMADLDEERRVSPLPPVVMGGVLVIPLGILRRLGGEGTTPDGETKETAEMEAIGMRTVMNIEERLGNIPRDVSEAKCGYDVESEIPNTGKLRFIEVKGRRKGAPTVTVTRNEILTALNKPEDFILAIIEVDGDERVPHYCYEPFQKEPDFHVTSVNYDLPELRNRGFDPLNESS